MIQQTEALSRGASAYSLPGTNHRNTYPQPFVHRGDTLDAHHSLVQRAIAHMRSRLDAPLMLDHLAGIARTSKFHFIRVFEEITGTSPHHFLACLRIQRAKTLLISSDKSVTDICFEVGYCSHGSFTRTFTSAVGLSPSDFRTFASNLDAWEFANRIQAACHSCRLGRVNEFEGIVDAPPANPGWIFIGAFDKGQPKAMPHSSTLMTSVGTFRIALPPLPEFQLLAVHVPESARLAERLCTPPPGSLVARLEINTRAAEPTRSLLQLHPWQPKGPPRLAAIPALLI